MHLRRQAAPTAASAGGIAKDSRLIQSPPTRGVDG
jgi:hypothetical protein